MAHAPGTLRRDPLSLRFDDWARDFLDVLRADPWEWHGRTVTTPPWDVDEDRGFSHSERAAQRSLYWNLNHAPSSGLRIRAAWSLQVAWGRRVRVTLADAPTNQRARLLSARVSPKEAGRRAVLIRGRSSYIGDPTGRGQLEGETWERKG